MTSENICEIIKTLGKEARKASMTLASASPETVNAALAQMATLIRESVPEIMEANEKDLTSAKEKGLSDALIDRLTLNPERIESIASGVENIMKLPCPVGKTLMENIRPNGLKIRKVSVPFGVFGMIYESRPNVTVDAAALCLKSHNAVILRGGSESLESSLCLHEIITKALEKSGLPKGCVCMVPVKDREAVTAMLRADSGIDVMIPRGGKGLTGKVMNEAQMPVFAHLDGICHTYLDQSANPEIALNVTLNAKMRRTGICGATETLLADEKIDKKILKKVISALIEKGCEVIGSPEICELDTRVKPASEEDWSTEYLDAKISVKTVSGVKEAVNHINSYGSHHTDAIIAQDQQATDYFLANVDSGIVVHNSSTQFADGGEFGMGAEIGIATGKLHARGPVGVEQLTTYKYHVLGNGQTRP